MKSELLRIMNRILREKQYPEHWKHALTVMIPKKDKDPRVPANQRPISLISVIPKLFESMLLETLKREIEDKDLIDPSQFGFQRRVGAVHQAAHLAGRIKMATQRKLKVLVAFLDVEKAYDRAWRERILQRLHDEDVNRELILMLQSILHNRSFCCRSGSSSSTQRIMTDGLPQGGPLSPLLFNILVGDLGKAINERTATVLQYADDTAIMVVGNSWAIAQSKMERALKAVSSYFALRRISINGAKTKIVKFGTKGPKFEYVSFNRKWLRIQKAGTYLGIIFTWDLRWKRHISSRAGFAGRTLSKLYRVMKHHGLSLRTKTAIIKGIIQPQATYGEEVWAGAKDKDTAKLTAVMRRAMRTASGAPYYIRSADLRRDLGFKDIRTKAEDARKRMKEKLAQDACPYRQAVAGLL